jgi:hypothetical protein
MAAHVNISQLVRTAGEDRSIVEIVEQFAGPRGSRHVAVQQACQQTTEAWTNYINPK